MGRRLTVLLLAAAVAVTGCASATATASSPRPMVTGKRITTDTIKSGGRTRSWVQITPKDPRAAATAPIIVVLSGITATPTEEMDRDDLLGLPSSGRAELVYPAGVDKSWDAGGCCGGAAKMHVNDVAFLQALVPRLDPHHHRPIYLAGYSNGGRLTYRIACTDPTLFGGYAVIKAMPEKGCVVSKPLNFLQIDSTNDKAVAYRPGDHGREHPPATVEVAHLHSADACPSSSTLASHGALRLTTWTGCRSGTRLLFAVYTGGWHSWPPPTSSTPGAATVIWNFVTALAPTAR
jgi:polyhydroxybutyrate depolymerase